MSVMRECRYDAYDEVVRKRVAKGGIQCSAKLSNGYRCRQISMTRPEGWQCQRHKKTALSSVVIKDLVIQDGNRNAEHNSCVVLEALGFQTLRTGWPDILATDGDTIFAAEIKRGKDYVKDHQNKCHAILEKAGIPVHVSRSVADLMSFTLNLKLQYKTQLLLPFMVPEVLNETA